jgi:hypothetical protein
VSTQENLVAEQNEGNETLRYRFWFSFPLFSQQGGTSQKVTSFVFRNETFITE